jgi:hypothetical protein
MLWLPAGTSRQLLIACRLLVPVTVALWCLSAAYACAAPLPWRASPVIVAGAATTAVIAAMFWATALRNDGDRRFVTLALADAIRRLPEDQRREMLVREVSAR